MPVEPGQTLLHYRVTDKLGEGGMGQVWRATDTTLDRQVAIKILPPAVADDPERMARFEREAKTLASLNHAGIAGVYGLHEVGGTHFIAMELVEGEDLAQRLARGRMPQREALTIAREIAVALEAAHETGIVHRDLKPANIMLTPADEPKVLDFGLAKAPVADPSGADPASSPTMTSAGSQFGMIIGTAAYMAPEQARGKPVDRRADIWSFGCVLYEMLAGQPPFAGDDVSEMLAHVITKEPDFSLIPDAVPPRVQDLVRRCLRKDPKTRLPDIASARIALDEAQDDPGEAVPRAVASPARPVPNRAIVTTILAVSFLVAGLLVGGAIAIAFLMDQDGATTGSTHLELVLDPPLSQPPLALAPDGSRLVYSGLSDGERHLWVRDLRTWETRRLPGTLGGHMPALAPDGETVAFFAAGRLKRTSLRGGQPEALSGVPGEVSGVAWLDDDEIVFTTNSTVVPWRIPASGGEPQAIDVRDLETGTQLLMPAPIPGHDALLAMMTDPTSPEGPRIVAVSLADGALTTLARGRSPHFVAPDRVVYLQADTAMTVRIDPAKLSVIGQERPASIDDPASYPFSTGWLGSLFPMDVSADGTLVYVAGRYSTDESLMWLDRNGIAETTAFGGALPRLSPQGDRIVSNDADGHVWVHDLDSGESTQLTFGVDVSSYTQWSLDGRRIYFEINRSGDRKVYGLPTDGSGEPTVIAAATFGGNLTSVGPDGTLMGYVISTETSRDIWIVEPGADEAKLLLGSAANERAGTISPKGGLFAYVSDEEGRDRIYIRDLRDSGRRWPVTDEGGLSPVWSRDGRELFYRQGDSIVVVGISGDGRALRVGEPETIFTSSRLGLDLWGNQTFDTAADGRLLVSLADDDDVSVRVVIGWGSTFDSQQQ